MRGQLLFEKARQDGVIQLDGQNGVAYHAGHLIAFIENLVWVLVQVLQNQQDGVCYVTTFYPSIASSSASSQPAPRPDFQMQVGKNDRVAGSVPSWTRFSDFVDNFAGSPSHTPPNPAQSPAQNPEKGNAPEDTSFGVSDLIDMINPLQHIPIVSQIYRSVTGDTIGAVAEIVGGGLFGGPVGVVASAGMVAYKHAEDRSEKQAPEAVPLSSSPEPVLLAGLSGRAGVSFGPYNA